MRSTLPNTDLLRIPHSEYYYNCSSAARILLSFCLKWVFVGGVRNRGHMDIYLQVTTLRKRKSEKKTVQLYIFIKNKNTILHPAVRSKICVEIHLSLQAVCDTSIAGIIYWVLCALINDGYRSATPLRSKAVSVACTRVKQGDVIQSVRGN